MSTRGSHDTGIGRGGSRGGVAAVLLETNFWCSDRLSSPFLELLGFEALQCSSVCWAPIFGYIMIYPTPWGSQLRPEDFSKAITNTRLEMLQNKKSSPTLFRFTTSKYSQELLLLWTVQPTRRLRWHEAAVGF